jgi:hypothetical protein
VTDPLSLLQIRLRDLMNDRADALIGGAAGDFAEYRRMTGVIEGLALAERELLDIQSSLSDDTDD